MFDRALPGVEAARRGAGRDGDGDLEDLVSGVRLR
jgi:hypothetical protein